MQHWRKAEDKRLTLADFYGQSCYLGIDLATKLDLNCVAPIFSREIDGKRHYYCVAPLFWVPEDTVYSTDSDKLRTAERYQSFVNQKALIPTDGAEVDYRIIEEAILKLRNHFDIVSCAIDPAGATAMSHRLQDEGFNPISVIQNYTNFSDPMREIEAALVAGRFHHDGNPIMTWCFQNVVAKTYPGSDDVVRPIKEGKENKTMLLPAQLDYKALTVSPVDAQLIDMLKLNRSMIASIFNVPAYMINDLEKATFSNISEQSIQFVRHTVMPWVVNWEQELNRRLFTRQESTAGFYARFNLAGLLRGTPKERAEFYHFVITDGWMSRNEARAFEDMNPVDGLDEMLVSVNAVQPTASKTDQPKGDDNGQ